MNSHEDDSWNWGTGVNLSTPDHQRDATPNVTFVQTKIFHPQNKIYQVRYISAESGTLGWFYICLFVFFLFVLIPKSVIQTEGWSRHCLFSAFCLVFLLSCDCQVRQQSPRHLYTSHTSLPYENENKIHVRLHFQHQSQSVRELCNYRFPP